MKTYKRTLTSTETHEVLSIRINLRAQPERSARWCEVCASDTDTIPIEGAAVFACVTEVSLHRLICEGLIQLRETSDGQLLVCLGNLTGARQPRAETENNLHTHGGNSHDYD